MTAPQFLELFISISLQVCLLIVFCRQLACWTDSDVTRSRIWSACQLGMLLLTISAAMFPHIRIVTGVYFRGVPATVSTFNWQSGGGQLIFVVWSIGVVVSLSMMLLSAFCLQTALKGLRRLGEIRGDLQSRAGLKSDLSNISVFVSRGLSSPFCWQFHQPVLIVPEPFLKLNDDELELILRHELAHLRGNHPLELFIQRILEAIFWFHPAVYWAGRQSHLCREMMCDAAAASSREEITCYLRVLLKVVEQYAQEEEVTWGLGFLFRKEFGMLTYRARRLMERSQDRGIQWSRPWLTKVAFLGTLLISTVWIPMNVLNSSRSHFSPCPTWTAKVLQDFGFSVRDYEVYDRQLQLSDRLQDRAGRMID